MSEKDFAEVGIPKVIQYCCELVLPPLHVHPLFLFLSFSLYYDPLIFYASPSLPPPKGPRVKLLSAIGRKDEFSDNDEEDDDNNLVTYNDNGLTDTTLRNASS